MNFIKELIRRKQNERLGFENIKKIFEHPWLEMLIIKIYI